MLVIDKVNRVLGKLVSVFKKCKVATLGLKKEKEVTPYREFWLQKNRGKKYHLEQNFWVYFDREKREEVNS